MILNSQNTIIMVITYNLDETLSEGGGHVSTDLGGV